MKRILFVGLLCLSSAMGMSQYYYYRGNQVPLKINADSVVLYTTNNSRAIDNDSIQSIVVASNSIKHYTAKRDATISSIEYIIGDSITRRMSNYFYIKLHNSADTILLNELVAETRTRLLGEVPYMRNWYKIMVSHSTINNTLEMSNYFYETGLFSDVDPGFVFHFTPNCVSDSLFSTQWGLPIVNACDAWAHTKGERTIRVAVLDDGIDVNHSEFSGLSFIHPYDCYRNRTQHTVYGSHGTFVTGVLAANHNSQKIAGIAPNITIIPISHIQDPSSSSCMGEELASGISYAVSRGADIINCSWGDQGGIYYNNIRSSLLESAIDRALTDGRNGKGCTVVFASGNYGDSGLPVDYPGCFDSRILVVGSIHPTMRRSYLTSYFGGTLDILAPGENICSTIQNNGYYTHNGTSFAAPIVSGVAALVLSINPDLTREEVTNIIELTAQKVGNLEYEIEDGRPNGKWHEEMGYGLVDAYAAVLAAQPKYIQNQIYQTGEEVYEYAPEITAGYAVTDSEQYGNVICEAGSEVLLRAMDRIRLKPGFHAQSGSKVHIVTDSWTYTPSDPAISAPQRIAPRSSSAPTDNTEPTDELATNNALENIESDMIQSTAIYTISGQLLQTIEGGQRDATHLPNGMYILQHRMSDGSTRSEKIANNK